ncbi:type VI secretion system protein ImpM [Duganella sp. CF517]|uniref:type VI secretion system-associated protein TagF n=1 Tax=Duganella sp. CF517 TaxID=1881038 RepID=UPI0008D312BB|nr:type VI secretion system-associated protein TagF [Duganella sp. CF517]SEN08218.1 type VI secretion system protein ImpM [Duganella sp. CF517]
MTTPYSAAGFFGKFPTHGDFVARRLPAAFLQSWDAWLQAGMADSRDRLGDAWLPVYLNSPIWRFALDGGVCGPQAWGGVLMPSVDRVGRYFPLTIAAGLDGMAADGSGCGRPSAAWYASLEAMALAALGEEFSPHAFDASLLALAPARAEDDVLGGLSGRALFWLGDDRPPAHPSLVVSARSLVPFVFTELLLADVRN